MAKDQNTIYHDTAEGNQEQFQNNNNNNNIQQQLNNEQLVLLHNVTFNEVTPKDERTATHIINRGPFFDVTASKNVTALVGKTAYLNCRVHNLNNKTVSGSYSDGPVEGIRKFEKIAVREASATVPATAASRNGEGKPNTEEEPQEKPLNAKVSEKVVGNFSPSGPSFFLVTGLGGGRRTFISTSLMAQREGGSVESVITKNDEGQCVL